MWTPLHDSRSFFVVQVGGDVLGFAVDIGDNKQREELITRVASELGALDSLVVVPPENDVRGDILDSTASQFDKILEKFFF
ncbi:hypothetical protein OESDEN_06686 [Oesophagostomum dentatum]|uniref:Uncharacterized protein n=1 Tax=Oesophagostomum dentatum TaxID=61180 RepID=A0A0B1TDG0_OESDE|nr:hypothetical protein OESDEN_06686 [Oesophagostomum dentatum]